MVEEDQVSNICSAEGPRSARSCKAAKAGRHVRPQVVRRRPAPGEDDRAVAGDGRSGYLGINIPEEYGGGVAASATSPPCASCRRRVPAPADGRQPGDLRHDHCRLRHRGQSGAGCRASATAPRPWPSRSPGRCRHQHPQHHHDRPAGRRQWVLKDRKIFISGVDGPTTCSWWRAPRTRRPAKVKPVLFVVRPTPPASRRGRSRWRSWP